MVNHYMFVQVQPALWTGMLQAEEPAKGASLTKGEWARICALSVCCVLAADIACISHKHYEESASRKRAFKVC